MNQPAITIALPIYNSSRYLAQCLRCILTQTFREFEVIVVLDGCTDDSESILEFHKDSRFVIVRKEVNEGLVRALNEIHLRAAGKYVARFDQDDLYHPERLERQVQYLESHREVDVLGTRFDYIDAGGNYLGKAKAFPLDHRRIKRDFQRYTAIGGPTCMYRLDRIKAVGDYDERFYYLEDVSLWFACLAAGYRFANLPDVLVHYRVHETQTSRMYGEKQLPQLRDAYALYGPRIWGNRARPFEAKEPRLQRLIRKVEDLVLP
jgi:glycosyltransferase involved in cell wall biosynthesis